MNGLKTAALLALMTALLMVIGRLVGGMEGMFVMFIIASLMNVYSYWNSDKLVLKAYNAIPVSQRDNPSLYGMVENLARKGNLPMPAVYIINSDVPNAFATGRNPSHAAVAVTTGIMDVLTDDEIEGVLAHELTHVKNRDTLVSTIAATMAGFISMIANALQWMSFFGGGRGEDGEQANPIVLIATIILAPLAASLIKMWISRSREYMADEGGAEMSGKPLALASALAKIDYMAKHKKLPDAQPTSAHLFIINPLSGVGATLSSLFSTHPTTASRIERLKEIASRR